MEKQRDGVKGQDQAWWYTCENEFHCHSRNHYAVPWLQAWALVRKHFGWRDWPWSPCDLERWHRRRRPNPSPLQNRTQSRVCRIRFRASEKMGAREWNVDKSYTTALAFTDQQLKLRRISQVEYIIPKNFLLTTIKQTHKYKVVKCTWTHFHTSPY